MFKRLRWRLTATYIGLVIMSMLVLGAYLLNSLEDYFYDSLKTRLETEALLACDLLEPRQDRWNATTMGELARRIAQDVKARVTIIDINGTVLGDSLEDPAQMENHLDRPEVLDSLTGGVGVAIRHSSTLDTDMMYVAVPIMQEDRPVGFLRLAMPLAEIRGAFFRLWSAVVVAVSLAVFFTILISLGLSKRLTEPIEKLTEFARRISGGDFDCRAKLESKDEIGELAEALNQMSVTIRDKVTLISDGKSKLEAVLGSMANGIIFVNKKGQIDLINPAAERFLSFAGRESIGMPHDAVIRHPELSALINEGLQGGRTVEQEMKIAYPDETFFEVFISPIRDQAGKLTGVVAVLRDITEKRKLERMRRDFVANVSHELKTPVTAIKGFTETLLDGALNDEKASREFVEIIDNEAERLKRLIQDLLDLSRIEAKQVKLRRLPVDISSIVGDTVLKLRGQAESLNVALSVNFPEVPVMAEADRDLIEQVLVNLVDNALKYTPAGGRVDIEVAEKGKDVVIWVRDTGIGIPPEDIDRVFERFYRVDKARSRAQGGTGLGLSIVKHIVEIHGGTVGVNSKPGKGSEFFFTLPKKVREQLRKK